MPTLTHQPLSLLDVQHLKARGDLITLRSHESAAYHVALSGNDYSELSSYSMDSTTVLGHSFPEADRSHCYWLPSCDLAYRTPGNRLIRRFFPFVTANSSSRDIDVVLQRWIPVSGSCFHDITVTMTFISAVRIPGFGKQASTCRVRGEASLTQKSAVCLPGEWKGSRLIHFYYSQPQCEQVSSTVYYVQPCSTS